MQKNPQDKSKKIGNSQGPAPEIDSFWLTLLLFVLAPTLFSVLIPTAFISALINIISSLVSGQKNKSNKRLVRLELAPAVQKRDRAYDLIVYGATGFTGRLAARYLATNYRLSEVKWALGGRSLKRLEELRKELSTISQECQNIDILIADSNDGDALRRLAASTRIVITTVGPFQRYGELLLATCASQGTDYIDITGEASWVSEMSEKYAAQAHLTNARLVSQCGLDSVPWDLLTFKLAKELNTADSGERLASVHHYNDLLISPSGGTIQTIITLFSDLPNLASSLKQLYSSNSAIYKHLDQSISSGNRVINKPRITLKREGVIGPKSGISLTESGNLPVIARSNALLNYSKELHYNEEMIFASVWQYINLLYLLTVFILAIIIPPLRWILQRYILRQPGDGAPQEWLSKSYLTVRSLAVGTKGSKYEAFLHYPNDPGYVDTARMIVEAALTLKYQAKELDNRPGGFHTPASLLGEHYLDRLIKTGCQFQLHKR